MPEEKKDQGALPPTERLLRDKIERLESKCRKLLARAEDLDAELKEGQLQRLLTLKEMARDIRVKPEWLEEEAAAGRMPCLHAGDRYLFSADAVDRTMIERASRTPPGLRLSFQEAFGPPV